MRSFFPAVSTFQRPFCALLRNKNAFLVVVCVVFHVVIQGL